ncbi:dipeptide ABC transporter ATP-binding protein [Amnibacterium setariae]|uniref:ABC transporter ATP-binding protein n=1 Tax=Amnibacterium setariae TaxID=2306585 RepID=A0A3A1TXG0_9MICO|nr:ABC transporter ATP-binding protein [Amnibacterium setariae]RIX28509.1 ABC transporter ATP-binding protein [Amnibacterium setariae]
MTEGAGSPVLAVRDLVVAFPGGAGRVVDSVGFDLHPGRVLALVGESGSGKSLTAMSVLGLLPPTASVSGSIRLEGEELLGADRGALRRVRGGRVGTVFQEPMSAFDPVYRVGDQVAEAIRVHRGGRRAALRARVAELLAAVGLPDPRRIAASFPHQLSGGQLQRAMIAMAISNDPVALIADEPTTALDVTVQAGILDLLRALAAERGTAILLITHDMGVVADLADDVLVLRRGETVERGPVRRVLLEPEHPYTRELLASVPTLVGGDVPASAPAGRPVAVLEQAVVSYSRRGRTLRALDGVDLEVRAGEVVGLVGESGSGKSTAGRALLGLAPLADGGASVEGVNLRRAGRRARREVRARIGTVFQDPASSLNPRTTVGWSIAEPLLLHTDRSGDQREERVAELLDAVRLPRDFARRYPHELSGGQRQRVAIARALALDPALLIADEPTSALDVSVQAAVLDLLADLQARLGFACLLISHDLAVVRRLADTVVVLRDGRVVERGPTARVLSEPADPYTRRLLAAVPVADPGLQAARREERRALEVQP